MQLHMAIAASSAGKCVAIIFCHQSVRAVMQINDLWIWLWNFELLSKLSELSSLCVFISAAQLKPEKVDFHIQENRNAHKTNSYEDENRLIIRRGQTFDVTVTFNRQYKSDSDTIVLQFVTGSVYFTFHDESKINIILISHARKSANYHCDVLNSVAESLANGQISNMHQFVSKDIALNAFCHEDEVNMEIKKNGI